MPFSFRDFLKGLRITPKTASDADRQGELEVLSTDGKLRYHDGSSVSPVVTESSTATLTNKTIDGDDNTVQDLALTSLKTEVADANKIIQRDGSGVVISGATVGGGGAGDVVTTDGTQTLTNKTIDGDTNTVQDLAITSLKTDLGAASTFISRDASGVPISTKAVPTGVVVGTTDTQVLSGKTIDGDDNTVQDLALTSLKTVLGDANKVIQRDASGIVVSGGVVGGNAAGDIVTTSGTQTLTGKTIDGDNNTVQDLAVTALKTDAGAANTFISRDGSGVPISTKAVPTGTVVGTTDSQVLTGKDIDGGTASNTSRITTPKNTKTNLDGLTRKEATIVYGTDTKKLYVDDGVTLNAVGAGSGNKNYLSTITTSAGSNDGNGDFEKGDTSGWSLGTVGTLTNGIPTGTPTFGSGASGNLSIAAVTSGQLAGTASLSLASSTATTQGNMLASNAFYIDKEDQAKSLSWSFSYSPVTNPSNANWSGTSSNSFGVAFWDVTNSAWLLSTGQFNLIQGSGVGLASGSLQTAFNTAQIRMVVYAANATSGAITVYFDDFVVGPSGAGSGIAKAPTQTLLTSGSGTYSTPYGCTRLEIEMVGGGGGGAGGGSAAGTAAGAGGNTTFGSSLLTANGGGAGTWSGAQGVGGAATVNSPAYGIAIQGGGGNPGSGKTDDDGNVSDGAASGGSGGASMFGGSGSGGNTGAAGSAAATNSGAGGGGGASSGNNDNVRGGQGGSAGGSIKATIALPAASYSYAVGAAGTAGGAGTLGTAGGAGALGVIRIKEYYDYIPSVDGYDGRPVAVSYGTSSTQNISTSATKITFGNGDKIFDTHSTFDNANSRWYVPVSGYYDVTASLRLPVTTVTGFQLNIYKNGVNVRGNPQAGLSNSASNLHIMNLQLLLLLNAGDYIEVFAVAGSGTPTITEAYLCFHRVPGSGPATVAASELVAAMYTSNDGAALTADVTTVKFANKVLDTHGAWNSTTGLFTAPVSGVYEVSGRLGFTAASTAVLRFYVDGVSNIRLMDNVSASEKLFAGVVYLIAGQQLGLRSDTSVTIINGNQINSLAIRLVK